MNRHNINDLAETLLEFYDEKKLDILALELAQRYTGRQYPLASTVQDITENHKEIIQAVHEKAGRTDCMPAASNYFDEQFYLLDDFTQMLKAEIDRCLPLGYKKPAAGFRFARGKDDLIYVHWIKHWARVSVGVAIGMSGKVERLNGNDHLPNVKAVELLNPPREVIYKALDPAPYHQLRLGNSKKEKKPAPRVSWRKEKDDSESCARFAPSIGYIIANETAFTDRFKYFLKKYENCKLSPNVVLFIVKEEYALLLHLIHQKNPNTFFSKKEVLGNEEIYVRIHKAIERKNNNNR
jgi:hypothetical protein